MQQKILDHFDGELAGKTFALWGLSFKPNTDDMRDAPSRTLMEALWKAGASVRAYDPEAADEARRIYPGEASLTLCESANDTLAGADALVVMTEWQEFRSPDFNHIKESLTSPVVFDGRNIYDPGTLATFGLDYYGIGRGKSILATQ